jgi:RNA polymerase sigma-70 factor (ECF subfamily)
MMDEGDFKKLYAVHAKRLYNFIRWMTGKRSLSDDILQIVFVKVWQGAGAPGNDSECSAWLHRIARNACIDHFRHTARLAECNDAALPAAAETNMDDGAQAWEEVAQLPSSERAVVYFHIKMGYTYAEIGAMLGMTETNARVTAFRALRRLREHLVRRP